MLNNKCGKLRAVVMWHLVLALWMLSNYAAAECNVCQSNQAACINSTSYYLCFGEKDPYMDKLYHCKDGFDCTDLNAICVQSSSQRRPSCGDTSLCGMCSAHRNYLFACLSHTTFQMCYGATRPTGQIGCCPQGHVCDASSDAVCVLEQPVSSVTCDVVDEDNCGGDGGNEGGDGPTTTPGTGGGTGGTGEGEGPTTPDPNESKTPQQVCEQLSQAGLFQTSPTDPYCKRYIYCFYQNGIIQGVEYNCSSGTYFQVQQKQCVFNKPTYCL